MKNRGLSPDRKGTHKVPTRANTEKLPKASLEVSENAKTYKKVKTLGKGEGFAVYVVESQDSEKAVMKQVDLNKISEEARMDVFKEAKKLEET